MIKDRVLVNITNTPNGLHKGHKALLEYAKNFGEVHVLPLENPGSRLAYLQTGVSGPKYKLQMDAISGDCEELGAYAHKPHFICVPEHKRLEVHSQVSRFINSYRDKILCQGYEPMILSSIMAARLSPPPFYPTTVLRGPEFVSFFYKHVSSLFGWANHEIFPTIVRNKDLSKISSTPAPVSRRDIRQAVLGARDRYKPGRNEKLLEELKHTYQHRPWRWYEICVWEGGLVQGRLEVSRFVYSIEGPPQIVEEVDYFA